MVQPVTIEAQSLPQQGQQQHLRRSKRPWCPSTAALERIAAGEVHDRGAALVDDLFHEGEDSAFYVTQLASQNEHFQEDLAYASQDVDTPHSYAQVMRLPPLEKEKWVQACRRESESHLSIPSISGPLKPEEWTKAPPVRLTWVFAKKEVYKARIVMLGQHMQEGIHFNETHAPVPSVTCVRIILAITAATRRQLTQLDIKTAFLNAPLDIELDVILPDGFGTGSDDDSFKSYEARRRRALTAIPGCPQGSRVWR